MSCHTWWLGLCLQWACDQYRSIKNKWCKLLLAPSATAEATYHITLHLLESLNLIIRTRTWIFSSHTLTIVIMHWFSFQAPQQPKNAMKKMMTPTTMTTRGDPEYPLMTAMLIETLANTPRTIKASHTARDKRQRGSERRKTVTLKDNNWVIPHSVVKWH